MPTGTPTDCFIDRADVALQVVQAAEKLSPEGIALLQQERLQRLLQHARTHSPWLAQFYRHLPARPTLSEIPIMERHEAVAHFDDWLCTRQFTQQDLVDFLSNPRNSIEDFRGSYRVLITSGSTAAPLRVVRDAQHNAINAALMQSRFWGSSKLAAIRTAVQQPFPNVCAITAGGGSHSSYLSFLRLQRSYQQQGYGDRAAFFSIATPLPTLCAQLNAKQPQIIGSYPSTLQILERTQRAGELDIHPLLLCSSAEYLSAEVMALVEETFHAPVMNNYCSTEGGEVAMLCSANHLHINSDWILIEPVDRHNQPMPYDNTDNSADYSDGVLLTNLANWVQPIIRYRVSDCVRISHAPCACGSPFPIIDIEGRTEDTLVFTGERGEYAITPPVLHTMSLHVEGCVASQFFQHSPTALEIRCEALEHADKRQVLANLLQKTQHIFADNAAGNVRISTSEAPLERGASGKLRLLQRLF